MVPAGAAASVRRMAPSELCRWMGVRAATPGSARITCAGEGQGRATPGGMVGLRRSSEVQRCAPGTRVTGWDWKQQWRLQGIMAHAA